MKNSDDLPNLAGDTAVARAVQVDAGAIDAAVEALDGIALQTPLQRNERLSLRLGADVYLKREDLQAVRSYKIRGAYNFMAGLDDRQRTLGVVCASAGNHAQGVAYACKTLNVRGRIHVPRSTPRQKRQAIAAIGGSMVTLLVDEDSYDEAATRARNEARDLGLTLVPAFDDPRVMAGQGTVAAEIATQLGRSPDVLVVPVGGGGLVAGCAAWLHGRAPGTRLVGVEPEGAASMSFALSQGSPTPLSTVEGFVDGAAVRQVGDMTFPIVRDLGVEVVTVAEGAVCTEMLELYQSDGIIAEPAGALATAGLRQSIEVEQGSTVVCVVSGGNNDVSRYAEIVERSLVYEGRKHYFLVDFPQEPGALRSFLDDVLGPDDDIALFEYAKRNNRETGPALVGVEIPDSDALPGLLARMAASQMHCERVEPDSPLFHFLV